MAQVGSKNHNSKLTEEQVRRMRELYADPKTNYSKRDLAKMYNVSETTAGEVIRRTSWTHVP